MAARRPLDPEAEKRRLERKNSFQDLNMGMSHREMTTKDRPERWSSRVGFIHDVDKEAQILSNAPGMPQPSKKARYNQHQRNLCNGAPLLPAFTRRNLVRREDIRGEDDSEKKRCARARPC